MTQEQCKTVSAPSLEPIGDRINSRPLSEFVGGLSWLPLGLWQEKQTAARPVEEESSSPNRQEMQEGPGSCNAPEDVCMYIDVCIYTHTTYNVCMHAYIYERTRLFYL